MYQQGKELREIALFFLNNEKNYRPIRDILVKNNIQIRTRSEVKKQVDNKNMGQLRNNGRKFLYKNNYFKQWSHNMAYIVGFIVADGTIKRHQMFSITLQAQDKYLLEQIANELSVSENKGIVKDVISHIKGIDKDYQSTQLQIHNKIMVQDLEKIGIMSNKSLIISEIKGLPTNYIPDFIRGMFDGDGSISLNTVQTETKSKQIYLRWRLTSGSKKMLEFVQSQLKLIGMPYKNFYCINRKNKKPIYTLEYAGKQALQIFEMMYKDNPELFLKRKKEKFDTYKEHYNKKDN